MANLEERFREAACMGDLDAVQALIAQNIDVNSKNPVNGWTALHWACRRGNEDVVRVLLNSGADSKLENDKGEKPVNVCNHQNIASLLGESITPNNYYQEESSTKFVPNYIRNAPLNGQVEIPPKLRPRHDFTSLPTTSLPSQTDDLVLKVRVFGSSDPDFIEIEMPRWKLTYSTLLHICCEELEISETRVERIRKLPNTRLRKDNDVKRLTDFQCLEIVLKTPITLDKLNNSYQSISTCKDQKILY
ncbi:PREDICTED: ankyrin repeat domain-containing protein 40-like [Nicrophorus vespilloides]|uniref:Ankyrin repeat domain-containing protein 40-like n=1 Tax=Nicrophorus vespilloides TaxID=110193 RepID=A0ABM1N7D3_NICVS|nr:PREDICTED: ankyrin repeat domain-containing protein 40-like [Nicrophorus vespilloides]